MAEFVAPNRWSQRTENGKTIITIPDEYVPSIVKQLLGEENDAGRFEFSSEMLKKIALYIEQNPNKTQKEIADYFGFHENSFRRNRKLKTIYHYSRGSAKKDAENRYRGEF